MDFTCEYLGLIRCKWSYKLVTWFLEMLLNQKTVALWRWRNVHRERNLNFEQTLGRHSLGTNPNFAKGCNRWSKNSLVFWDTMIKDNSCFHCGTWGFRNITHTHHLLIGERLKSSWTCTCLWTSYIPYKCFWCSDVSIPLSYNYL